MSSDMRSDMGNYTPIDCGDYDILEVVCLDRNKIELETASQTLRGTATGLVINAGAEYLLLGGNDGSTENVRIDHIRKLTVLSRPARFEHHVFKRIEP